MKLKEIFLLCALILSMVYCGGEVGDSSAEYSGSTDKELRRYNLDQQDGNTITRPPCDTTALEEWIIDNYPHGEYLASFDKTFTYNIPGKAVVYYKKDKETYIFAAIAKSKVGERFIEVYNVTGYESSFVNLDSTKLGTAFFWLTLFKCDQYGDFEMIWESEVPIHGGFNAMKLKRWGKTPYIEMDYEDGIISGHRNYNFFLIDGLLNPPHLMETYVGIVHKRTMADINGDKYPDYYEYLFDESETRITVRDSIPFYWDPKKQLYVTKRSSKWWRYF